MLQFAISDKSDSNGIHMLYLMSEDGMALG